MAEVTYMAFRCLNPDCRKEIKLKRPARTGVYKVTCPHCGIVKQLRLTGSDAMQQPAAPDASLQPVAVTGQSSANIASAPKPATPDNSRQAIVELKDDFIVGVTYTIMCPHCGKQEIGFAADKAGVQGIVCPWCKGRIGLSVRNKTEVIVVTQPLQMFKGKLILLRRGWLNKDYPLPEGKTIIGRRDEAVMSDIAIENDSSMSRRSVEIEVVQTDRGYTFKLSVLKAANPVLHNNRALRVGDSVSLNFGDSIVMGKTKFRFDKDV
ncbi:MAG: FHA domain-containing protein [Muribaculaceae bacterium]|nr:FHA domain-containing protein [Muribaculaceae bacterium]